MNKRKRMIILKAFEDAKKICDNVANLTIDDDDKIENAMQAIVDLFDARRIYDSVHYKI